MDRAEPLGGICGVTVRVQLKARRNFLMASWDMQVDVRFGEWGQVRSTQAELGHMAVWPWEVTQPL